MDLLWSQLLNGCSHTTIHFRFLSFSVRNMNQLSSVTRKQGSKEAVYQTHIKAQWELY